MSNNEETTENADIETPETVEERTPRNVTRVQRASELILAVLESFGTRDDVDQVRDDLGSALAYLGEAGTQLLALPTKAPRKNPFAPGVLVRLTDDGRVTFAYLGTAVDTVGKLVSDSPGRNRWVVAFPDGTKTAISARLLEIYIAK